MAHPAHLVAAGMLVSSPQGRVLMVQTHNRVGRGLILPGGIVEHGESPAVAAERETSEELGLDLTAGALLLVAHKPAHDAVPESLQFVFASATVVAEDTPLMLQPDEIAETVWLSPEDAVRRHVGGGLWIGAALDALRDGRPRYLDARHG